jgi:hypothetical protein
MDLTAELVALVDRTEPDPGPDPGTVDHTDAEMAEMAQAVLAHYSPDKLWVFAYGSLIWKPEFEIAEKRHAVAYGWHRSFCLKLTRWRGTRELPALMLALDRGGSCVGMAYSRRYPRANCEVAQPGDRRQSADQRPTLDQCRHGRWSDNSPGVCGVIERQGLRRETIAFRCGVGAFAGSGTLGFVRRVCIPNDQHARGAWHSRQKSLENPEDDGRRYP